MATDIGTGSTLTYAGFTMELLNLSWSGISRGAVQTSHMTTTPWHTFLPTDLTDPGELTAEVHLKTTEAPPITAVASNLTVTWPTAALNWQCSAFMTSFEFNDPLEDVMTATATFKCSDTITFDVTP